jgi:hypothetical protein
VCDADQSSRESFELPSCHEFPLFVAIDGRVAQKRTVSGYWFPARVVSDSVAAVGAATRPRIPAPAYQFRIDLVTIL